MACHRQWGQAAVQCPTQREAPGHRQAVEARFWWVQPPLRADVGWRCQSARCGCCPGGGWQGPLLGSARVGWGSSWPPLGCATSKGPCQPAETLFRTLPPLSWPWLGMPAHPPSSAPSTQNTLTYLQPPQLPTSTKYIGRTVHQPPPLPCPLPLCLIGWPKEALC